MKCENLDIWKKSARISADIYKYFSKCKDFGFKDQITRASLSIPSNIAEGLERPTVKDQIKFLYIAQGSAAELITQIYVGIDIEYIDTKTGKEWIKRLNEVMPMLHAFISKLQTTNYPQQTNPKD
jgi:four helix bundle protein